MRSDQTYWCLLFLLISSPLFPQSIAGADSGIRESEGISWNEPPESTAPLERGSEDQMPSPTSTSQKPEEKPYRWDVAIYPALVWAPIFGVGVTLPPVASNPIAPPPSASVSNSFNGAYFGGARIEKSKWAADLLFMWAGLAAKRETPFAKVDLDFVFGHVIGEREVLSGLYVGGGVRRVALNINATVDTDNASRSPGFWDPLVSVTYRRQLGRKWRILLHGDGGGFGAGSDVDLAATARADWQFARHFGITMGYGGLHLSESSTINGQTLAISPTLHGPIFGFGIFF